MPNLVIKLKRLSEEEINSLTGQNSNKVHHGTKKKNTKKATISRKDKENDEASNGRECSKSEKKEKKVTKSQSKRQINNKPVENKKDSCPLNGTLLDSSKFVQRMTRSRSKILCEKDDSLSIIISPVLANDNGNKFSKSFKRQSEMAESDDAPQQAHKKRKLEKDRNIEPKLTKTQSSKTNFHQSNSIQQNDTSVPEANRKSTKNSNEDDTINKTANFDANNEVPSNSNKPKNDEIAIVDFKIGEVVWAKIRGFPYWPAKIENISGQKKQIFRIYWFNDYRTSKVFKSQIFKFHKNFEEHAKNFNTHIGVETAAREALMYSKSQENGK